MFKLLVSIATLAALAGCKDDGVCGMDRLYSSAQAEISDLLKSPATAVYPPRSETTVTWENKPACAFVLGGYVDSQNGYGALLRSNFRVSVQAMGTGDPFIRVLDLAAAN